MFIYPAIDIIDGKCVRLTQGSYEDVTIFHENPLEVALYWQNKGAKMLHIVDLDGAKKGVSVNDLIIDRLVKNLKIPFQLGGGIRTLENIQTKLDLGVSKVILGSAAIKDPLLIKNAINRFGCEKIIIGLDAKDGYLCVNGWVEKTLIKALDFCKQIKQFGVKYVIYTDIAKDGMLEGPNLGETKKLINETNLMIIASGGIHTKKDLLNLKEINAYGVIIGKALYTEALNLNDILSFEEVEK